MQLSQPVQRSRLMSSPFAHLEHLLGDRLVLQRRHERLELLALHPDALRAIALLDFHRERAIAVRGEARVLDMRLRT